MTLPSFHPLHIFAPAKINLYLHLTGRQENGYHTIDSLIGFAAIGDKLTIETASTLSFEVTGPFADCFHAQDLDAGPGSSNLVIRAVRGLARLADKDTNFKITLEKNLPLGAGMGGGSSDSAAALKALLKLWDLRDDLQGLDELILSLGADVPVCFACSPMRVQGIGEILEPAPPLPAFPIVLIYPGIPCHTQKIFMNVVQSFQKPVVLPRSLDTPDALLTFLETTHNMLSGAAIKSCGAIQDVLNALNTQKGCALARMSGSGSTCFGVFEEESSATRAARDIAAKHPGWWVRNTWLGKTAALY